MVKAMDSMHGFETHPCCLTNIFSIANQVCNNKKRPSKKSFELDWTFCETSYLFLLRQEAQGGGGGGAAAPASADGAAAAGAAAAEAVASAGAATGDDDELQKALEMSMAGNDP